MAGRQRPLVAAIRDLVEKAEGFVKSWPRPHDCWAATKRRSSASATWSAAPAEATCVVGLSDAPIPWPLGQLLRGGRRPALILYADLAEAVMRESAEAVMHSWGVKRHTVWQWRKALGVPQYNPGTTKLKSELLSPVLDRARPAAIALAGSAERRAKISAARKGKPRPPHVVEAVRRSSTGRRHGEEARAKMSQANRKRGALVPGTDGAGGQAGQHPAAEGRCREDGQDDRRGLLSAARVEIARRQGAQGEGRLSLSSAGRSASGGWPRTLLAVGEGMAQRRWFGGAASPRGEAPSLRPGPPPAGGSRPCDPWPARRRV
jgi:hypothetical protein